MEMGMEKEINVCEHARGFAVAVPQGQDTTALGVAAKCMCAAQDVHVCRCRYASMCVTPVQAGRLEGKEAECKAGPGRMKGRGTDEGGGMACQWAGGLPGTRAQRASRVDLAL